MKNRRVGYYLEFWPISSFWISYDYLDLDRPWANQHSKKSTQFLRNTKRSSQVRGAETRVANKGKQRAIEMKNSAIQRAITYKKVCFRANYNYLPCVSIWKQGIRPRSIERAARLLFSELIKQWRCCDNQTNLFRGNHFENVKFVSRNSVHD